MPELTFIQQIAVWILPIIFAITIHEAAHAWVAYQLGDNTAHQLGRLSFNPIKHIDLIGSIIVPLLTLSLSNFNFVFGWAKPVPIDARNFANPRRDIALSTAAGPLSNLLMALFWIFVMKLGFSMDPKTSMLAIFIVLTANAGVIINVVLAFLNLLPIPPLDGSKILMSMLPARQALAFQKIEPYGFIIILLLLVTHVLNWLISPPINWFLSLLKNMVNL